MTDWRSIPVKDIDWRMLHARFGRTAHALRRLCLPRFNNQPPVSFGSGSWSEMSLGAVADMGARQIMRHHDVGPKVLATLQAIIDLAASESLPMIGGPATDALKPTRAGKGP